MSNMFTYVVYVVLALVVLLLLTPVTEKITIEGEGITIGGTGSTLVELSVDGLLHLEAGSITVYFKAGQEKLAQETADALQKTFHLVQTRLGLPISPLKIALFQREDFGDISSISFYIKQSIWPLFVSRTWQSFQEGDLDFQKGVYWVMTHEAVETAIAPLLYLDAGTRWIGDGLAEYSAYTICKELSPSVISKRLDGLIKLLSQLLESGQTTYNFIKDFPVRIFTRTLDNDLDLAGYGVSLGFWLDIANRYGEETIHRFWTKISARKPWCIALGLICFEGRNAQDAARLLSELTGEDIWQKLQNMDLQEVLRTLEQAGARG